MKKFYSKMKAIESSQHFSHYKSMGIFTDAQGQLTPQSMFRSCVIAKSSKTLMAVLVTCNNEEIHPKMKTLEWSQHFSYYKSMGMFPDAQGQLMPQSEV